MKAAAAANAEEETLVAEAAVEAQANRFRAARAAKPEQGELDS